MLNNTDSNILDKVWVAPMAGVSDSPFRVINRRFGAKNLITEMLSVEGLIRKQARTLSILKVLAEDKKNLSLQLFGSKADSFYQAILFVGENYKYIREININAGCPVKKVVKHGAGAWLLKDTENLRLILKASKQAIEELKRRGITLEFTLKIRTGWDEKNYLDVGRLAQDEGVDRLIIHGRTAKMQYTGFSNYDDIKNLKENISIPVVANGDIHTLKQGMEVMKYTGADAFMVGRILVGNPWFFRGISKQDLSLNEIKKVVLEHISLAKEFYGELTAPRLLKKHLIYYVKGNSTDTSVQAKGSRKAYFNSISLSKTLKEQLDIIENYFG